MGGAVARYKLKLKYKHKRKHTYYARTHTNASSSFQAKSANEKMLLPGCLPVRVAVCLCVMLATLLLPLSLARTVVVCRRGWLFLVRLCVCVCVCVSCGTRFPLPPFSCSSRSVTLNNSIWNSHKSSTAVLKWSVNEPLTVSMVFYNISFKVVISIAIKALFLVAQSFFYCLKRSALLLQDYHHCRS